MKGEKICKSLGDLINMLHNFGTHDFEKPLIFSWKEYSEKRSLPMNSLSHVWYGDIAKQTGEIPKDVKSECKLDYGVPILLAETQPEEAVEIFQTTWESINFAAIANKQNISFREAQLKVVSGQQVTSIMDKNQMYRYLTHMQNEYGKNGIILESTGEFSKMRQQQLEEMRGVA